MKKFYIEILVWGCIFLGLFIFFVAYTFPQTVTQKVNYNTAVFSWQWTQGVGGMATGFNVKCGPSSGNYSTSFQITPSSTLSVPLKTVLASQGTFYCAVTAFNDFGESPPSNELFFESGVAPLPVSGATLK